MNIADLKDIYLVICLGTFFNYIKEFSKTFLLR